jgi:hypothetical protein
MKMSIFGLVAMAIAFAVLLPASNIQLGATNNTSDTVANGVGVLSSFGEFVGLFFLIGGAVVLASWTFGGDW